MIFNIRSVGEEYTNTSSCSLVAYIHLLCIGKVIAVSMNDNRSSWCIFFNKSSKNYSGINL